MRMATLSERSGVPVTTIKHYLREGLLPRGDRTAVNQARYSDDHLRRLRLIRVLTDVGGLDLARARAVLAAVDDPDASQHEMLGAAQWALSPDGGVDEAGPELGRARADVDVWLDDRGLRVHPDAPARQELARVLVALRDLGFAGEAAVFDRYADAARDLAAGDVASLPTDGPPDAVVEHLVVGTVLFDAALIALRRLAQEDASARRGSGR